MKKTIMISIILIFIILFAFLSFYLISTTPKYVGDFNVVEFSEYIENESFQIDKNIGKITDYKSAAKVGKSLIAERFENSNGNIFEWMGCDVQHDKENDIYFVRTYHVSSRVKGGAFDVIIRSDGTVLAIWGEK